MYASTLECIVVLTSQPTTLVFAKRNGVGLSVVVLVDMQASELVAVQPHARVEKIGLRSHPQRQFFATTMHLKRNASARLHVDKNNHGPSYIITFGKCQGGRLWDR